MKQRLGVGAALLTDPELMILDEPGNGLDPAGIVEMRKLTRRLVQMHKTIFVSSHILAEIRQVCTRSGEFSSGAIRLVLSRGVNRASYLGQSSLRSWWSVLSWCWQNWS